MVATEQTGKEKVKLAILTALKRQISKRPATALTIFLFDWNVP